MTHVLDFTVHVKLLWLPPEDGVARRRRLGFHGGMVFGCYAVNFDRVHVDQINGLDLAI
jgi:hypothetical protein